LIVVPECVVAANISECVAVAIISECVVVEISLVFVA
jgi:hypothetical protein